MLSPGKFQSPSRQLVVYGQRLRTVLPQVVKDFWASQIVSVTNSSLSAPGALGIQINEIVGDGLKNSVAGIRKNTPREDVLRVTAALRSRGTDAVVAIGGGSVVDAVKAARICLTNNVRDERDMDRLKHVTTAASPRPYLVSIPTTLSGADYTQLAVVTDTMTGQRDAFHHQDLAPDAVILDPEATLGTPSRLWLSGGIRALEHAIETWCVTSPSPFSDATSLYAARVLMRWLSRTAKSPDDLEARLACQVSSWMAMQGTTSGVSYGASHGIGCALAAISGAAQGVASGILLPHVLRHKLPASGDRQNALMQSMGCAGASLAGAFEELVAELGLPARLRDVGVAESQLDAVAFAAVRDAAVGANVRPFESVGDVRKLLEAAF